MQSLTFEATDMTAAKPIQCNFSKQIRQESHQRTSVVIRINYGALQYLNSQTVA